MAADSSLPLRQVVLFSSGVGYFDRGTRLKGATTFELAFKTERINDILKSLVLFDPHGGARAVTYAAKDSLSKRLQEAGLSIESDVSLGQLLQQFQGAALQLQTSASHGGETLEGVLVSVNTRTILHGDEQMDEETVNILSDSGFRSVALQTVARVSLLDTELDAELRAGLQAIASGLGDQKRGVRLHFEGDRTRDVRVGYLHEMPVWKTTYRLVLDAKAKPYLQGWAIVENTTDEDWTNVNLSLISGRPISFIQDLYQPLFITRPTVKAQTVDAPLPQLYEAALEDYADEEPEMMIGALVPAAAPMMARSAAAYKRTEVSAPQMAKTQTQAKAVERGELFEYAIAHPVSLPRQQAAMVPIVGENIGGEKLSIWNEQAGPAALHGFLLKNTSGLHLAGGPLTIFAAGIYAGDAQIGNVAPNDERLISYAVDLELIPSVERESKTSEVLSLSVADGRLLVSRRRTLTLNYTLRNNGKEAKTVLVQQPLMDDWQLIEPTANFEKTVSEFRLRVDVSAGKTTRFKVLWEQPAPEFVALWSADLKTLLAYSRHGKADESLRESLREVLEKRRALAALQSRYSSLQRELKEIDAEQNRIRQNMAELDHQAALYGQYVQKLTAQETRIEAIRDEMLELQQQQETAEAELREQIDNLQTS